MKRITIDSRGYLSFYGSDERLISPSPVGLLVCGGEVLSPQSAEIFETRQL